MSSIDLWLTTDLPAMEAIEGMTRASVEVSVSFLVRATR